MNVKNIVMENMVLQADEGLDMTEGTGITLKNVRLVTKQTNPVLNIHNSKEITLDRITYNDNADLLLNVSDEKSTGIVLNGTDVNKAKKGTEFTFGAKESALKMK